MLILTRRVGETLMIGDEVTVTVLGVKGNQVRIAINAPRDVTVHRDHRHQHFGKVNQEPQSGRQNCQVAKGGAYQKQNGGEICL